MKLDIVRHELAILRRAGTRGRGRVCCVGTDVTGRLGRIAAQCSVTAAPRNSVCALSCWWKHPNIGSTLPAAGFPDLFQLAFRVGRVVEVDGLQERLARGVASFDAQN